jgi:hypothetical protein
MLGATTGPKRPALMGYQLCRRRQSGPMHEPDRRAPRNRGKTSVDLVEPRENGAISRTQA